jgi:hypothetical protein
MHKKIIGIVGFIGAGKGTISDHLVEKYGYKTESFAKPVKDAVACIFGWDRQLLEGDTIESRQFREVVDEWWASELGIKKFTPRWMLQQLGTDIMRGNFHQDIWIKSMKKRLTNNESNIVITDCRFSNEVAAIKSLGGIIVRTKRGEDPEWFNVAKDTNNGLSNAMHLRSDVHPSEWGWIGCEIDYLLENDGSKEELHQKIDEMIKTI